MNGVRIMEEMDIEQNISEDPFTKDLLRELVITYNLLYNNIKILNDKLDNRKIRRANYPSEITENIVKFAIIKKYNVFPCWDVKKGDICLDNDLFEVKGSIDLINGGPCSFGPTEKWEKIYFVDCIDHCELKFKVYEINLSNKSEIWENIKVNKKETFKNQCDQKRRPRIKFKELLNQIPEMYIDVIFNDHLDKL